MAPTRQKKRKSTESTSSVDVQSFPAPPQLLTTKTRSPARTPMNRSPIKKASMGITVAQKQALIDNLQLEITERARKLRAQYMLQAQGLRTRIEIRVNRIPMALRRANMGDLLFKYSETSKTVARTSPAKLQSPTKNLMQREQSRASPSPQRPAKRMSDEMAMEKKTKILRIPRNVPEVLQNHLPELPPNFSRTCFPQDQQTLDLSHGLQLEYLQRNPFSQDQFPPLKPSAPTPAGGAAGILTSMVERAKTTRGAATARKATDTSAYGGVGRGKRTVAPAVPPKIGRGRAASDSSNNSGSTVIKKAAAPAPKKAAPVAKRTVMSTIKGMGATTKKAPGPKAVAAPTGGRVLRKRN